MLYISISLTWNLYNTSTYQKSWQERILIYKLEFNQCGVSHVTWEWCKDLPSYISLNGSLDSPPQDPSQF